MKKTILNAAKKYLLEVCKNKDKHALIDFYEHLCGLYSEEIAVEVMEQVNYAIFDNHPEVYDWLINSAEQAMSGQILPEIPILTADDLAYLLTTEGRPNEKNFKFHPTDKDKLIVNHSAYEALKNILTDIYSDEEKNIKVKVDIDYLVEVVKVV